ncbi:MAG: hypothetical protein RLN82_02915 [Pseudomonadales bacterium]
MKRIPACQRQAHHALKNGLNIFWKFSKEIDHQMPIINFKNPVFHCLIFVLFLSVYSCNNTENKSEAENQDITISDLPDPLEAGWNGASVCEVFEENDEVRVLKCTFPPGVGHERHYHVPHIGYTIAGGRFRITDSTGTREVEVPTGSKFSKDKVSVHEVLNIGETTAEFLIIEMKQ